MPIIRLLATSSISSWGCFTMLGTLPLAASDTRVCHDIVVVLVGDELGRCSHELSKHFVAIRGHGHHTLR